MSKYMTETQGAAAGGGHQRHPHGGRDAGAAHHLHGHHAHVVEGRAASTWCKTQNPIAMQAADKSDAVIMSVTRDGKTYLGTHSDAAGRSAAEGQGHADQPHWTRVSSCKADARARYEKVVDVVDNLRAAGVDQLGSADRADSGASSRLPGQPTTAPSGQSAAGQIGSSNGDMEVRIRSNFMAMSVGGGRRSEVRYQYDADDRRLAGADHHFHGDHALTPKGLEALVPQPPPPNQPPNQSDQRTVVITDQQGSLDDDQPGADR